MDKYPFPTKSFWKLLGVIRNEPTVFDASIVTSMTRMAELNRPKFASYFGEVATQLPRDSLDELCRETFGATSAELAVEYCPDDQFKRFFHKMSEAAMEA